MCYLPMTYVKLVRGGELRLSFRMSHFRNYSVFYEETSFVPEFHTSIYQYILYPVIFFSIS